jgi:hypothetical protein
MAQHMPGRQRLSLPSGTELQVRPLFLHSDQTFTFAKRLCLSEEDMQEPLWLLCKPNLAVAWVQINVADREQEIMGAAGLQSIGGSGGVGRGTLARVLRIVPGHSKPSLC